MQDVRQVDNLGPREEAPLSAGQGQACLSHMQSLSDSCLGAGEGGSEGGGTLSPSRSSYFLSSHLCSLFQAEEEWIQRLPDARIEG